MMYSLLRIISIAFCSFPLVSIYGQDLQAIIQDATQEAQCSNGSIDLTLNGGFEPYSFAWTFNGVSFLGNDLEDLANRPPGEYCVTVTDALCGTATACFDIDCCSAIPNAITRIRCGTQGYVGDIVLNWPGSPYPYMVNWYNSKGEQMYGTIFGISDVPIDTYTAEFFGFDTQCGTSRSYSFGIEQLKMDLIAFGSISHCGSFNTNDGFAMVEVTGGRLAYNISWSGPNGYTAVGPSISGLSAPGVYTATVIDFNGNGCSTSLPVEICCCSGVGSCTVLIPQPFNLDFLNVGPTNGNNGSIDLISTGGSGKYSYLWSNGARTEDLDGLWPGTYCVTASDGCDEIETCIVLGDCGNAPLELVVELDDACLTWLQRGSINLTVVGGTTPFLYEWDNGITENTSNPTLLSPGEYCVTVTDQLGCKISDCFYIDDVSNSEPPTVDAELVLGPSGGKKGAIKLNVVGDEEYIYEWSNGRLTPNIYLLDEGSYSVTVSNEVGCELNQEYYLSEIPCSILLFPILAAKNDDPNIGSFYPCDESNGLGSILIEEISFGSPPYTLVLEKEVGHETYEIVNTLYFYEPVSDELIIDLPRDRYRLTLTDICGRSPESLYLDLCSHCGYSYDEVDKIIKLYDAFNGSDKGILLELKCTCSAGCFLQFPRIDVDVKDIVFMSTDIKFPGETMNVGPGDYTDPVDNRYYLNGDQIGGMPFDITVEREDGCEFKIPISWNEEDQKTVVMQDAGFGLGGAGFVLSNGHTIDDYYFGDYKCTFCNPLNEGGIYLEDYRLCDGEETGVVLFELTPNNETDPCRYGGTITAYYLDNNGNAQYSSQYVIPETEQYEEISTNWVGRIGATEVCQDGGGCIYDSDLIFNKSFNKDILTTYCYESYVLPDQDNDGIADEFDPCPTVPGTSCNDPVEFGYDCTIEWAGVDCNYAATCNGTTEPVVGTFNSTFFRGISGEFDCWYCFYVEYCEVITSTGELFIEFQSDPTAHLLIIATEDPMCDEANNFDACSADIYCDTNFDGIPQQNEFFGYYCIPNCSAEEYVEDYLDVCHPGTYHDLITNRSFSKNGDTIITSVSFKIDEDYAREYIYQNRIQEINKLKDQTTSSFRLYPNPASNYILFECKNSGGNNGIIQIYNLLGETIYSKVVKFNEDHSKELINLEYLSPGIFFLKYFSPEGKELYSSKFIKI